MLSARAAAERPDYLDNTTSATGWYRKLMGMTYPPPVNKDRQTAVEVQTGQWGDSLWYLQRIGRNPSADCLQCSDSDCIAARCSLCGEVADTPKHVLLTCTVMVMLFRLRLLTGSDSTSDSGCDSLPSPEQSTYTIERS